MVDAACEMDNIDISKFCVASSGNDVPILYNTYQDFVLKALQLLSMLLG
jgi:hypothetical protein